MNILKYLSGLLSKKKIEPELEPEIELKNEISESLFWEIRDGIEALLQEYQPCTMSSGRAVAFLQARERYLRSKGVSHTAYLRIVDNKARAMIEERKKLLARERIGNLGTAQNIPVV